jgi:glutaredoxin 3
MSVMALIPQVTIYTRAFCPACTRAISLLKRKGASVREVDVTFDHDLKQEMMARSGRCTFPQIFVGDTHIGGCDDLCRLDERGGLDTILQGAT